MTSRAFQVADAMQRDVVTLAPDERLDLAHDIMTLGRLRHLPVLTDGSVVGILTQRDLFRAAIASVLDLRPAAEREWLRKIHVAEVMTQPVQTASSDWPLRRAVDLMVEHRIGCVPVVDAGHLVGLLSETDCLRILSTCLNARSAS